MNSLIIFVSCPMASVALIPAIWGDTLNLPDNDCILLTAGMLERSACSDTNRLCLQDEYLNHVFACTSVYPNIWCGIFSSCCRPRELDKLYMAVTTRIRT